MLRSIIGATQFLVGMPLLYIISFFHDMQVGKLDYYYILWPWAFIGSLVLAIILLGIDYFEDELRFYLFINELKKP